MLSPQFFINKLSSHKLNFYAGVPDSLLKNICAYITATLPTDNNIITANEGSAIALGAGYYMATGKIPVVYMQNSGQGNTLNPLISLTDKEVYSIPILLVIGWRGEPGVKDEPQHIKQGKITLSLLDVMGIPYEILSDIEEVASSQLDKAIQYMNDHKEPYALVIRKDTFSSFSLPDEVERKYKLSRENAIRVVSSFLEENSVIVSTTGMVSRELFEIREENGESHQHDFLTVGSMGHASQIALGISMQQKNRRVYCFDGDGALIMHMGSLPIIGAIKPLNLVHVVFNNGAHDSVGGQPTVAFEFSITEVAKACGYKYVFLVDNEDELLSILETIKTLDGPIFLEIRVCKGARKNLGRPTSTPIQNKNLFMNYLMENERND